MILETAGVARREERREGELCRSRGPLADVPVNVRVSEIS